LGTQITAIHGKARALEEGGQELPSRMRFMLEVLIAVRNNNVRRVPGADIERTDRLRKVAGTCIRGYTLFNFYYFEKSPYSLPLMSSFISIQIPK
jgi:hypothetical protein